MVVSIIILVCMIALGMALLSVFILKFMGKGLVYKLWLNIFPAIGITILATSVSDMMGGEKNIPVLLISVALIITTIVWSFTRFNRIVGKRIESSVLILKNASEELNSGSASIAAASQSLAQGASEQAASLEQTSSSLEEITAMTRNNAANMKTASSISQDTNKSTAETVQAILTMQEYMRIIKESVNESSKIMKTIDEIAFQTNLLALNAAVEAARAGEAGRGFAVVAEEVRSLARKSAEAAKTTGELMEKSVSSVETGVNVAGEINKSISELSGKVTKVNNLVSDSATASEEQSHGIEQINRAVSEMEKVTGSNSANAEETAASSEELAAQSSELEKAVSALTWIIS